MSTPVAAIPTLKDLDRLFSPEHRFADALVQMERELAEIPARIDEDRLYRTREAAERLAVSARTLEGWRSQGKGPATTVLPGGGVRYRGLDLRAFIEQHKAA